MATRENYPRKLKTKNLIALSAVILLIALLIFCYLNSASLSQLIQNIPHPNQNKFADEQHPSNEYLKISKIYMSREVEDTLQKAWSSTTDEFLFCMYTENYKDSYIITGLFKPAIEFADIETVIPVEDCPENTSGQIHSHPLLYCMLSDPLNMEDSPYEGDLTDAELFTMQDFPLMGIMCRNDSYAIYTKSDLHKPITALVVENNLTRDVTAASPCPPGEHLCNDVCWIPCEDKHESWSCTSEGGVCE